jgi:peptide/nickel transport system substrate-binding protein
MLTTSRHLPRRLAALVMTVLFAALLLPIGARPVVAQGSKTLRIGVTQTATALGLNPFQATASMDYQLIADVYDLLIEFGTDLSPQPGLAESWTTSPDGLTWTYKIRSGATWSDGQPVTAEDVAFTYNYIRNSEDATYKGPQAPDGNDTDGDGSADNPLTLFDNALDLANGLEASRILSIEATDPTTVVIKTSEPLVVMSQIFIPILPKHIWEKVTFESAAVDYANYDPASGLPVGSGPYIMKEFKENEFMRLEANPNYWGGAPKIDEIVYQYFENDEAMINALKSGEVDLLVDVAPSLLSVLQSESNITINQAPSSDFIELGFNSWDPTPDRFESEGCADCPKGPTTGSLGDPWLTRADVRAALASLIDKDELVKVAASGLAEPGVSLVGSFNSTYNFPRPADSPANYPGSRDAATAAFKATMAALGFSDTDGDGILNVPDTADARAFDPVHTVHFSDTGDQEVGAGQNFKLRLYVRDDHEKDKIAAELIEGWMEQAGVDVDRRLVKEDPDLYDDTYPSSTNADMDMYIWGWGPDPDPDFILSIMTCSQINGWQDVNYCDPSYDQLYAQSQVATSVAARAAIVKQLQAKLYDESPYAVLWYSDTVQAYRSDLFGGFTKQAGDIWSGWGYGPYQSRLSVAPASELQPTAAPSSEPGAPTATPAPSGGGGTTTSGDNSVLLIAVGVVVVVVIVGALLLARRRKDEDEEE